MSRAVARASASASGATQLIPAGGHPALDALPLTPNGKRPTGSTSRR